MKITSEIDISKDELSKFCKQHHIESLSVFGSAIGEDFQDDSDIDLLVEFKKNKKPSLFELIEIEKSLSELFDNREIDLRTYEELSKYFRDEVRDNAEVLPLDT